MTKLFYEIFKFKGQTHICKIFIIYEVQDFDFVEIGVDEKMVFVKSYLKDHGKVCKIVSGDNIV